MNGRNILVIGGTHGISNELLSILDAEGANIISAARSNSNLEQFENVKYISFDVLEDELQTEDLPDKIDGVFYAPGSINLKPFHRLKEKDFEADLKVNYLGAVKVLQTVFPLLKKSECASVVLVSTVAVNQGMPFHSSIAGAKGAVEGLVKSLAAEWAPKIRVNAVAPALVNTRLAERLLSTDDKKEASNKRHPLNRYGEPEDVAHAVHYLLSDKSSWMTGQVLGIDGGLSSLKV